MQFSIDAKTFADKLSQVSKAIPAKPTHPILGFVHIMAVSDGVILKGFDLSLGIQTKAKATVDIQGSVCLPSNLLTQIVSKIDGVIDCKYDSSSQTMAIKSQGSKFNIRGESADEYPDFPEASKDNKLEIPTAILQRALKATITTASNDESKQILMGVCMNASNGSLELASTDGHRLSVFKTNYKTTELSVVPHSKMLNAVQGFLTESETIFTWDDTLISFKSGDNVVVGRILSGTYPQYDKLIPTKFERELIVNAKELKQALDRVLVMTDKKNNMVKWSLSGNNLTLESTASEVGTAKAVVSIERQLDDSDFEIGFNGRYLLDCLKSLDGTELTVHLNGQIQPVIITDNSGDEHTYLIMPVKL